MINIMKKNILSNELFKQIEYKKITPVDASEEIDEYFVIYKIKDQQTIKVIPKLIDKAKRIPRKAAIPFPPLNFNQIGNTCPRRHKRADK